MSVNYKKHEGTQGQEHGPIHTGTTFIPGDTSAKSATGGGIYNGIDGYPKGTPTEMPEISFDNSGAFGKVPKAKE